jgi:OHS family lactose permease-like MFS transporter
LVFNFAKQLAAIFLSAFAGNMYDRIGFQDTYLILGCFVLAITLVSAFTLSGRQPVVATGGTLEVR